MKALAFDDVLLVPAYNHLLSRKDVSTLMSDKMNKLYLTLPIMSANMDTITGTEMADYIGDKGGVGVLHRFQSVEDNALMYQHCRYDRTFASIGCSEEELKRVEALRDLGCGHFNIDVAHAHARYVGKMLDKVREMVGEDACIMAGNVATYAGADFLASHGADIIKVGIGGGSVCTTRIKTGFGVPTLTSVKDCARVDRSIVADGGIRTAGDIVKALAFGADFVMIGSMLAGTHPTPGDILYPEAKLAMLGPQDVYKEYRGMASKEAKALTEWKTAEGVSTKVPYKSMTETDEIIHDIIGGLRSGLTYAGAKDIRELQRKLDYIEVTESGKKESKPHRLD